MHLLRRCKQGRMQQGLSRRTLPRRAGDDGDALVAEAVLDKGAAADRGDRERQPQERRALRKVRQEIKTATWAWIDCRCF